MWLRTLDGPHAQSGRSSGCGNSLQKEQYADSLMFAGRDHKLFLASNQSVLIQIHNAQIRLSGIRIRTFKSPPSIPQIVENLISMLETRAKKESLMLVPNFMLIPIILLLNVRLFSSLEIRITSHHCRGRRS